MRQKAQKIDQYQINQKFVFQPCFQSNASPLSRLLFAWTYKLIKVGNSKHLQMEDLSDLTQQEDPRHSADKFKVIFDSISSNSSSRLFLAFKGYLGYDVFFAGILSIIANLLLFSGPFVINNLLRILNSEQKDVNQAIMYVSILVVCYLLKGITIQAAIHKVNLNCIKVLNCINPLIFGKILRLSSSSRKYLDAGAIMNNINVDSMSFYSFIMTSPFLFSGPSMIIVAVFMLVAEVGWVGFIVPIVFFLGLIVQQKLMSKGLKIRKSQLSWSDKRSKCVNEYFSGIRIIKYYGWESVIFNKIDEIRENELNLNFRGLMIRTYVQIMMNMLPIIASIIIFSVHVAIYGQESLTTAKVYTVLSIFNLIGNPIRFLVAAMINYMNGRASLSRIEHFLQYEEKSNLIEDAEQKIETGSVIIRDSKFMWETETSQKHYNKGRQLLQNSNIKINEKLKPKKKLSKKKQKKLGDDQIRKKKKKQKNKNKKNKKNSIRDQSILSLSENLLTARQGQDTLFYDLVIGNMKIKKGEFISVIGKVGSGKSTFLSAILGQVQKVQGSVATKGNIAYVSQTSWLRSVTIRQNILFQSPYDSQKYHQILNKCELVPDLQILEGGDLTQIGEKGVNLSGGQRQRICIARAAYSDADIFLIDDCLSALDAYVGKNIFYNVLKYLHRKGKTIVFATNNLSYINETDKVIILEKGRIVDFDTPQKVLSSERAILESIMKSNEKKREDQEQKKREEAKLNQIQIKEKDSIFHDKKQKPKEISGIVKVEQRLRGSVPFNFYYRFFAGPSKFATFFMFLSLLLSQAVRVGSDWWLGQWSNNYFKLSVTTYMWIYGVISLFAGGLFYLKGIFFAKFIIKVSKTIQKQLIRVLLKSPLNWFDVTPTGRILARTTKDQDDLDNNLSFNVQNATQNLFVLIASILLVCIATPLYLIIAAVSGFVYFKVVKMYLNSSRQIKRLQSITKAPVITHFQQTISGIYLIRAFKKQESFIQKYYLKQKNSIVATVNQNITSRWIGLITQVFSILTIASAGFLGILSISLSSGSSSNLIGLSLVWSLSINSLTFITLRIVADTQSDMNAVVRLYDYIDNNPSQKSFQEPSPKENGWPSSGELIAKNVSYKYRPELPLVVNQITFDISQNAKIGIIGRTGSGKSTITLGMLRILQIATNEDQTKGSITLDSEDISQIGLHHLRHNVAIIPQDPILFTGTIKQNIDPFNKYKDEDIAECLKKVQMWDKLKQKQGQADIIAKKVYSLVDEGGSNFSLGQRQLLCMARALIRKPKVLLMDEATASIDDKTDETIQGMIKKQFKNTTVITIAHRLNTIINYDKILVLNKGQIQEYDTPEKLILNPDSYLGKTIRSISSEYYKKIASLLQIKDKKQ